MRILTHPAETIEELVSDQAARITASRLGGLLAPGLDSRDCSIVIVDNVVLTNRGQKRRLEELGA